MPPKPYSRNDPIEIMGVNLLKRKLESKYIIKFINELDKIPNQDGEIELLDDEMRPLGRLCVQIKTQSVFSENCVIDSSAFDYADLITIPFIYFYVSLDVECVRWIHVNKNNGIYKRDVQNITIHAKDLQEIKSDGFHLSKWLSLVKKYQEGSKYFLSNIDKLGVSLDVSEYDARVINYFSDYCRMYNALLVTEARCVNVAKFNKYANIGVIIFSAGNGSVKYSHHLISKGAVLPFLLGFKGDEREIDLKITDKITK